MTDSAEHDGLQLRLLGELEVVLRGRVLALPQSRKTRALLGYLALSGREHRRERLCSLFWDIADDPRAALRWSLSKLREVVDNESERPRLVADREHVALDLAQTYVDVHEVQRLLSGRLEDAPTAHLETARARFRGELLEGLELPDFHAYQAWLLSERAAYRDLQRRVLRALLSRSGGQADRALALVRELVHLDPSDETARSQLLELLHATGKFREAEEQSRVSRRLRALEPVQVPAAVGGAEPARQSSERVAAVVGAPSEVPFVERVREREQLRAWRVAPRQELAILLVLGDAGLGKSRLLRELAREAARDGWRLVSAAVPESRPGWPYAALRELLTSLLEGTTDSAVRQALAPLLSDEPASQPSAAGKEQLFRAVAECIERAARGGALTLVLDDAHWLDDASVELLEYLALALRSVRVDLILTAREGELRDHGSISRALRVLRRRGLVSELNLLPLSRAQTLQLVSSIASIASEVPEQLYERCAGNPLFAIELAREPFADDRAPPASISLLVRDRLDALSPEQCDVLRWASVLGDPFDTELLVQVVALDPELLIEALERLSRYRWLELHAGPGARASFVHDIVRRTVYDQLSEPRRRLMHGRVARALAAMSDADGALAAALAHHAVLAGDRAMGARACLSAGQRCLRLYAHADAYNLARRGLSYARELPDPERTSLSLQLLALSIYARRPESLDEVMPELAQLSAHALDLGLLDPARAGFYARAFLLWERGAVADAQRTSRELERSSRLSDPRDRVLALGDAARCLAVLERDLPEAEAYLLEAEAVAPSLDEPPLELTLTRGILSFYRGELARAEAELEQATQIAQREGNRIQQFCALEFRTRLELTRGRHEAALALASELTLLSDRLRGGSEAPYAHALQALCRYACGLDSSPARFDAALEPLALADAKQRHGLLLAHAAQLECTRAAWPAALRHAQAALTLAAAMERYSELAVAHSVLVTAERAGLKPASAPPVVDLDRLLDQPITAFARGLLQSALALRGHAPEKERRDGARHRRTSVR